MWGGTCPEARRPREAGNRRERPQDRVGRLAGGSGAARIGLCSAPHRSGRRAAEPGAVPTGYRTSVRTVRKGDPRVSYDATSITVLEGLDAVRKRPGMYIGSTGERGLHHLVYEVVDNSVDEALAGYCDTINVTLQADGGVKVVDNGRGIPVDEHPVEKRPAVEVVLTVLHAGGKFGGGGYSVSGGLHGVGVSVVNALSKQLDVRIRRDGAIWTQTYDHSVPVATLVNEGPTDGPEDTGTTITFYPDEAIFETVEFDFQTLQRRFQEMAFLNKGLTLTLTDERPESANSLEGTEADDVAPDAETSDEAKGSEATARTVSYCYADGLVDYVKYLNARKGPAHPSIIDFDVEDIDGKEAGTRTSVEVAMQWNTGFSESVYTFANTINTHEGGTHEEGFRAALTVLINEFARSFGLLKEKEPNLTGEDAREGLTAIVSVKLGEPQFEGQTKTKLGNSEIKGFVQKVVREHLKEWFEQNPNEGKEVIRKVQQAARARMAARNARDLSRKGLLENRGLPGKLFDCGSTNPEECEIFIVEGDSAGGSAKQGRESRFQAILPIRGKILNVEKARIDRVLQNTEVQSLISALGTGIHEQFDVSKLRYHKLILMADADVDGQHIRTLLLTFVFRFMRPLIEGGYVYLAQPPLYKIKWPGGKDNVEYAYSDRERDGLIQVGREAGRKLPKEDGIQRFKGLGEMPAKELWDTTMDPDRRVLLQVTLDEAAQADELFSVLMGEDVEARRHFIQRNAKDVRFLDI
jgi:DNA gyrase subunit B